MLLLSGLICPRLSALRIALKCVVLNELHFLKDNCDIVPSVVYKNMTHNTLESRPDPDREIYLFN